MENTIRPAFPRFALPRELEAPLLLMRSHLNLRYRSMWTTQTTSITPAVIWASVIPREAAWFLWLTVNGYAEDGSTAFYERQLRIKRGAGAPTLVRATTPIADDEDVAGWGVAGTVDTDGAVTLAVTGDVAMRVRWIAWVEIQEAPRRDE